MSGGASDVYSFLTTGVLGGILGVALKSLWDVGVKRFQDIEKTARHRRMDFLERQLSDFFWPIYLRLQKDNAVWERILGKANTESLMVAAVGANIESNVILPNHDEIVSIIEKKIHLVGDDPKLLECILKYLRHVSVYKAIRQSGETNKLPEDLGEAYPTELFSEMQSRTHELQRAFDELIGRDGVWVTPEKRLPSEIEPAQADRRSRSR